MTADSHCPLENSRLILERLRRRMRILSWGPLPALGLGVGLLHWFDPHWYSNAILVAILCMFAFGQVVAFRQFLVLGKQTRNTMESLSLMKRLPEFESAESFRANLLRTPPSYVRDLLLSWIQLGGKGPEERGIRLLQNSRDRREILEAKVLGVHVSLNRNILKLGFVGTLVGLLMTFPPMRAAVMGLGDSGGELKFINDIAAAIDEDAYAIQATLVSMGFSLFLEAMVLQLLERLLAGFQLLDTHLGDWYVLTLRPWLTGGAEEAVSSSQAGSSAGGKGADPGRSEDFALAEARRLEEALREAQREMDRRSRDIGEFRERHRHLLGNAATTASAAGRNPLG